MISGLPLTPLAFCDVARTALVLGASKALDRFGHMAFAAGLHGRVRRSKFTYPLCTTLLLAQFALVPTNAEALTRFGHMAGVACLHVRIRG